MEHELNHHKHFCSFEINFLFEPHLAQHENIDPDEICICVCSVNSQRTAQPQSVKTNI